MEKETGGLHENCEADATTWKEVILQWLIVMQKLEKYKNSEW